MKRISAMLAGLIIILIITSLSTITGQDRQSKAIESITADEIKGHIHFLASDFMNGRVGPSKEYEIAAQYVAAQFAAAGLEPAIEDPNGSMTYFQGVPFAKTSYSDNLKWKILKEGTEIIKDQVQSPQYTMLNHLSSKH